MKVTGRDHAYVLRRDQECVASKLGFDHVCRDPWGRSHAPTAIPLLTIEHVKAELRMGVRAESDPAHMVALCSFLNLRPPTKEMRQAFRDYLAHAEPRFAHGAPESESELRAAGGK